MTAKSGAKSSLLLVIGRLGLVERLRCASVTVLIEAHRPVADGYSFVGAFAPLRDIQNSMKNNGIAVNEHHHAKWK